MAALASSSACYVATSGYPLTMMCLAMTLKIYIRLIRMMLWMKIIKSNGCHRSGRCQHCTCVYCIKKYKYDTYGKVPRYYAYHEEGNTDDSGSVVPSSVVKDSRRLSAVCVVALVAWQPVTETIIS